MKRSLDNKVVFYVVLVVAILNVVAYVSMNDWKSFFVFVSAGLGMMLFNQNKTMALFVAILVSAITRTAFVEGYESKETPEKTKTIVAEPKPSETKQVQTKEEEKKKITGASLSQLQDMLSGSNLEGLAQHTNHLAHSQKKLTDMAADLAPMMKQATDMINKLPEGFLESAMKNFNKQNR